MLFVKNCIFEIVVLVIFLISFNDVLFWKKKILKIRQNEMKGIEKSKYQV